MLVLEDGRTFRGRSFGGVGERGGEVVFNTAMSGYQEVLTDPSYAGQIVTMTCPEIGNYGTNGIDVESAQPWVEGFVVRQVSELPSNWRATQGLPQYLSEHGIPGIAEIDTRALTRHLRTRGSMKGVISSIDRDPVSLARKAKEAPGLDQRDLVAGVSCNEPYPWDRPRQAPWAGPAIDDDRRPHCVAFDFGLKQSILRMLFEQGFRLTVVPASTTSTEVSALQPDAVFLSNGPGDPQVVDYAVRNVRQLIGSVPIFGICLGHQIAALALGGRTYKLKFGHHGANHPVKDLRSQSVAVTSQNHGYAVRIDSLPSGAELTHVNLNDGTCEGFVDPGRRLLAVQYHPESSPGPHDSFDLFREFRAMALGTLHHPIGSREDLS
jgi:carbamoyl-phosphate synthase small subunit